MIDFGTAVQSAFFATLSDALSCPVVDGPAQGVGGDPVSEFPFCTIGESVVTYADADNLLGAEVVMTLHFFSREAGMKEAREHMSAARFALHRQTVTWPNYRFNFPHLEAENLDTDPDGKTRHGVQDYRVFLWWHGWGSDPGVWRNWDVWDNSATWNEGG